MQSTQFTLVGPLLDPETWEEDQAAGQPSTRLDLGPLSELGPNIKCFLQELAAPPEEGGGSDVSPEPPAEDYERWIKCVGGHQVNTPDWWQELMEILGINDFQELGQKIRAFFEIPQVKNKAQDINNDYSALPVPICICWREFLPPPNPMFPSQDFKGGQIPKDSGLCSGPPILGRKG